MQITDEKQKIMPMPEDLLPNRGKQLIVPESVWLVNPVNDDLRGEVSVSVPNCHFPALSVKA